jgi:hypothetical protein
MKKKNIEKSPKFCPDFQVVFLLMIIIITDKTIEKKSRG